LLCWLFPSRLHCAAYLAGDGGAALLAFLLMNLAPSSFVGWFYD